MLPSALLVLGRFAFDLLFHTFFGFSLLFHERNLVDHGSNVECGVLGLCSTLIIVYILVLISAGLPLNSSDLPRFCGPFEIFRFQISGFECEGLESGAFYSGSIHVQTEEYSVHVHVGVVLVWSQSDNEVPRFDGDLLVSFEADCLDCCFGLIESQECRD